MGMRTSINVHNPMNDIYSTIRDVEYKQNDSLFSLFERTGIRLADVSKNYPLSGCFAYNKGELPYLIRDDKAIFNVPYSEALVVDFLSTMQKGSHSIDVEVGMPQAGGPDFLEPETIWTLVGSIAPIIERICSITGINLRTVFDYLKRRIGKKKIPPQSIMDLVYQRSAWNSRELATILGIDNECSRSLLKGFGYIYDNKRHQYVAGPHSDEVKEKLSSIPTRSDAL